MALIQNAQQNVPLAAAQPSAGPQGVQSGTQSPSGGQSPAPAPPQAGAAPKSGGGVLQQPAQRPNTPEQDAYEKGVITVMEMLFERGAIENIIHAVIDSPNIGLSVAESVFHVMNAVDHHHGSTLPMPALVQLAIDSIGLIGQMLQNAGRPMNGQEIVTAIQALIVEYMRSSGATKEQIQSTLQQVDPQQLAQLIDKNINAVQGTGAGASGDQQAPEQGEAADQDEPDADDQGGGAQGPDDDQDDDVNTDDSSGLQNLQSAGDQDDEDNDQPPTGKQPPFGKGQ